jgi:hypothetical protein
MTVCVVIYTIVCHRRSLFSLFFPLFSFLSLKFMLVVQKFKIVFLFIDNSTLIFILFFSNFCYWLFCQKKFLISNHDLLIFFKLDSHSFYFDFFCFGSFYYFYFSFQFSPSISDSMMSSHIFFLFQVWSYFESFCIIFFFNFIHQHLIF